MAKLFSAPQSGPVPGKVSEDEQVLSKGMKVKQPLEKTSLTSQEERDSRCGRFSGSGTLALTLALPVCMSLEPRRIRQDWNLQPQLGLCGSTGRVHHGPQPSSP